MLNGHTKSAKQVFNDIKKDYNLWSMMKKYLKKQMQTLEEYIAYQLQSPEI